MSQEGQLTTDVQVGLPAAEKLPAPRVHRRSRNYRHRRCPFCGAKARRCGVSRRVMHDLCRAGGSRGLDIHVSHSKHQCSSCKRCFNANMNDLAPPKSQYTHRVRLEAIRLVLGSGLSYRSASKRLRRDFHVLVPFATIHNWVEEVIHAGPPVAGEPVQATPQGKQEKQ